MRTLVGFSHRPWDERKQRTRWNQVALFGLWLRGVPELLNEYAMTGHLLGLPYRGI
jgi:hypothetical protein